MNFLTRIKLLYIPFLLTAIGMWGVYTFLNWLIFVHLEILYVKEFVKNWGFPMILPLVIIFIYIRPRLKLLELQKEGRKSWEGLYMFVFWFILTVPTIIAQSYMETYTGKLTELQNIAQITLFPKTKFYTLKEFYIGKYDMAYYTNFEVTGKRDQKLNMDMYIAAPIYINAADTTQAFAWLGLNYSKSFSNNLDEKEKENAYNVLLEEGRKYFEEADLNEFVYLKRVPYSDQSEFLSKALIQSPKYTPTNKTQLFFSCNEPFEDRYAIMPEWLVFSTCFGSALWLIMMLSTNIDNKALRAYEADTLDANEDINEFLNYFKFKRGFVITPVIIYLNIAIFIVMFSMGLGFMSFDRDGLIMWGANYGPLTENGEGWRLLSSVFLHGGFWHLAANALGLLFAGLYLEPLLGKIKYSGIYLITGVLGGMTSLWWNNTVVSLSTSAAVFGLYGVFLALLITRIFPKEMGVGFLVCTALVVAYNLVMGVFGNAIDNSANIGGGLVVSL